MGRRLGRCKKCNCQATIEERDGGICIWCAAKKLENEDISWLLAERDRLATDLAAANATLDRLREAVPEGWHWCADCEKMTPSDDEDPDFCGVCKCENYWHRGVHVALQNILYPPETTSIRDTAAAHGFDAMPDDLAQRSVDGETNYVRLYPENDHANHD